MFVCPQGENVYPSVHLGERVSIPACTWAVSLEEGNVFTCMCHSVHRDVSPIVQPPDATPAVDAPQPTHSPARRQTVNRWSVRILLECIVTTHLVKQAKVMFSQASVCPTLGGLPSWQGAPSPDQAPTPNTRHLPPGPDTYPPEPPPPPPPKLRSMRGWYASYWNASLIC